MTPSTAPWRTLRARVEAVGIWRALPSLVLLALGWLLSPLCWWNDLLINLPLAVGFGRLVSLLHPAWLVPGLVAGYWLSNLVGLLLMQNGALALVAKERKPQRGRELLWGMLTRGLYTLAILGAVRLGWLTLPLETALVASAQGSAV